MSRDLRTPGVALLAVSYDEPDALQAYAAEYGVGFPLLSDPDSEIIELFGILRDLVVTFRVPEGQHPLW